MHTFQYYKKYLFGLTIILGIFVLFMHLYLEPQYESPSRATFIKFMLIQAEQSNQIIIEQRNKLLVLYNEFKQKRRLSPLSKEWLLYLSARYDVSNPHFTSDKTWKALLNRVDIIPNSLVIAQAINESEWGQSRFAQDGNNFFGIWCYTKGCGILPKDEGPNHFHAVRSYATPLDSVEDYMLNLNSHDVYKMLRDERAKLRQTHQLITGLALVNSLVLYSQRREAYVISIRNLINSFDLAKYDLVPIAHEDLTFSSLVSGEKHNKIMTKTKKTPTPAKASKSSLAKNTHHRSTHAKAHHSSTQHALSN